MICSFLIIDAKHSEIEITVDEETFEDAREEAIAVAKFIGYREIEGCYEQL